MCSRFALGLAGCFVLFGVILEKMILLFAWGLGFEACAGKCPGSNLFHAKIVSFLRKNVETVSLQVNKIRAAIKRLQISC